MCQGPNAKILSEQGQMLRSVEPRDIWEELISIVSTGDSTTTLAWEDLGNLFAPSYCTLVQLKQIAIRAKLSPAGVIKDPTSTFSPFSRFANNLFDNLPTSTVHGPIHDEFQGAIWAMVENPGQSQIKRGGLRPRWR